MAGHSKYANIKHRKGAQDAKRAKFFTKLVREIIVAAKSGPDPDANARLRGAIIAARAGNLPKDRIEAAIAKGSGESGGDNYEEIRYEGYGTNGVAFIVETLSDNRNRTASSVRSIFAKHGGSLGETGAVSFMFDQVGYVSFPEAVATADEMFEAAVELGAESAELEDGSHNITCAVDDFAILRDGLIEKYGDPESASLIWMAKNLVDVPEDKKASIEKLIDSLEDDDDVQNVYHNAEI